MEIIAELEPVRRGIYAGAVGYFTCDGELDLAIAIRTAVREGRLPTRSGRRGHRCRLRSGELEYEETSEQGAGAGRAIAIASEGSRHESS